MLFLEQSRKWFPLLFAASLFAGPLCGQALEISNDDSPVVLRSRLENEAIISSEQIRRVYIKVGTNEIAMVLPRDFRLNAQNPRQLVLEQAESGCFITVRVTRSSGNGLESSAYRSRLFGEYPGADLLDEFSRATGEGLGAAFDLQRSNLVHTVEALRAVFLPTRVGLLEFTLHSKPQSFAADKDSLDSLLWSFKSDRDGRIAPIQTPSQPPAS